MRPSCLTENDAMSLVTRSGPTGTHKEPSGLAERSHNAVSTLFFKAHCWVLADALRICFDTNIPPECCSDGAVKTPYVHAAARAS